jgi:hypothetical protein
VKAPEKDPDIEIQFDVDLSELDPIELDTDEHAWLKWQGAPCHEEIDGIRSR